MDKLNVPEMKGTNYFIWALKIQAALSFRRLDSVISAVKPDNLSEKDTAEWNQKNSDAVAYIKLSLSDEQALQFAVEGNAKILWDKMKSTFTGQAEDRKIYAGNELKNLQMKNNESANDYVARARGIATKCHSLGLDVKPRELVYDTVRGLKGKFSKVRVRIFHEKTIPYNSESNGKAERVNRVLLDRARSLLYESELPLKVWAEAINCSTQVSNVTPRKGKEKNTP
ncbi:Retrovirus-related Pol polyprotein like [Argiope bruennichi]|uniref:Retrovirus-related Pol polyprotein like n=1 Tax=Argiope bruennichi TaxID=94029 RepID=A0A8T0FGX3_ARGBR|nr:Retrovirus-related Pol polyprotein like [Argiope bruennichi]